MKKNRPIAIILNLFLVVQLTSGVSLAVQQKDEPGQKELRAAAARLANEALATSQTLNSAANRISLSARSAAILFDLEREPATAAFESGIAELKRLITEADMEAERIRNLGSGSRGNRRSIDAKTRSVIGLRTEFVQILARHLPYRALSFLQETDQLATNRRLVSRLKRENRRLESFIMRQIAARDVTKALEIGRGMLGKGLGTDVYALLIQIYSKNREQGSVFGKEVAAKIKRMGASGISTRLLTQFFNAGLRRSDDEQFPLFSRSDMTALSAILADRILNPDNRRTRISDNILDGIKRYSPDHAARLELKLGRRNNSSASATRVTGNINGRSLNLGRLTNARRGFGPHMETMGLIREVYANRNDPSARVKAISEARTKIVGLEGDSNRIRYLSLLANMAITAGEKELASEVLGEAEGFVRREPRDKQEFSDLRMLINAYAMADPVRAFEILENVIYRLNGVVDAYVRYMEFSTNWRVVEDGEMRMTGYSRQFTGYARVSDRTARMLVAEDLERFSRLPNLFDRPELATELRLILAASLLKKAASSSSGRRARQVLNGSQRQPNAVPVSQ